MRAPKIRGRAKSRQKAEYSIGHLGVCCQPGCVPHATGVHDTAYGASYGDFSVRIFYFWEFPVYGVA